MPSRLVTVAFCAAIVTVPHPAFAVPNGTRPPAVAVAPGLVVTGVEIVSGRLMITGTTTPGTIVTLERRFQARANSAGDFAFSVLYIVEDCIVELSTSRGGGRAEVAGCGPKGATGPVGPRGPTGARGPTGLTGPTGNTGAAGATGSDGPEGPAGPAGDDGATGPAGASGDGAMFAVVEDDGTWSRGYPSGAAYTSDNLATGQYEVIFGATDITECAFLATIGSEEFSGGYSPGFVIVVGRASEPSGVFLQTFDTAGTAANRGFHLSVTCPPSVGQ